MKQYTLKELKKATLKELEGTCFKCTPKRYKRICKSLDCVRGLRWLSGRKPSVFGTSVFFSDSTTSLYYVIINGRIRRGGIENFNLHKSLTRISIKA